MAQLSQVVTLQELIESGCLTECCFSLGTQNDPLSAINGSSGRGLKNSMHILNAAKIALLMAKTFARYNCNDDGNKNLSSVQLDQISAQLFCSKPSHAQDYHDFLEQSGHKDNSGRAILNTENWNIVDMSILSPAVNEKPLCTESMLRHLGKLTFALFSQNEKLPMRMNETKQVSDADEDDFSIMAHQMRMNKRGPEQSLFTNLLGAGYPVSVCRLISDMVDTGIGGNAEHPFGSIDEVIDDLNLMTKHPHIYLYDIEDFFKLGFGQRYYGQKKEMSQLLEISTGLEQSSQALTESSPLAPLEVVFISGMPGVGKTHLASRVGEFLFTLGSWMVAKTKFERGAEHESRQCVFSMFDKLVANIVLMKDSFNKADVDYNSRARNAIADAIDEDGWSILVDYVPSIGDLMPIVAKKKAVNAEIELRPWQLTFFLSKLMSALLSLDRFVMLCLDDIQWCDPAMLAMLNEIIIHSGHHKGRCICVVTCRSNEVSEFHPLTLHFNRLKECKHTNVTEIKLSSLTKDNVIEMVMTEMRLPKRMVGEFAEIVHRKTLGHALFIVELLNSLVRNGTISYSLRKRRYDFDWDRLISTETWESVGSLIVSNLSLLSKNDLQNLRIICCFGIQCNISIVSLIKDCPGVQSIEMPSSICRLINDGILERDGPKLVFSHDLIHQEVYETMPSELRQYLQVNLGKFLGSIAGLDGTSSEEISIEASIEQLNLSDSNEKDQLNQGSTSLVAVDLINSAGPDCISIQSQSSRFARWNLFAATESKKKSNFQAVLHYCEHGFCFLGKKLWADDLTQISRELHEIAAFASYAVGNTADTTQFAEGIIENVSLEQSLFAQLMILRALESEEEHQHIIARGLALLRSLNLNVPSNPTPQIIMEILTETGNSAYKYSEEDIITMQKSTSVNSIQRNVMHLLGAVSMACYQTASPYYPLVMCELVNYSLENGVCEESAQAFALLGYYQMFLQGNYISGKYWADVAEKIIENSTKLNFQANLCLKSFCYLWHKPWGQLTDELFSLYEISMKAGYIDGAMYAICQYWRMSFARGEKLSVISRHYDSFMESIVKHCYSILKFVILDFSLINELTGNSDDPYSYFDEDIHNEEELVLDGKERNNSHLLHFIARKRFFSSFLFGDFSKAAIYSKEASSFPTSRVPKIQLIHHYFYHGLMAFRLCRDGKGASYLKEGQEMLEFMTIWHEHSPRTFENKLYLLEAEYLAASCNRNASLQRFDLAIKSSRDNGFIQEQGLAHELKGHYLSSIIEIPQAKESYEKAYHCYIQWGANAKAERIRKDHNLEISRGDVEQNSLKHNRDW